MSQFFTAHSIHLEGNCDIDARQYIDEEGKHGRVVSVGSDDVLYIKDLNTGSQQRQNLSTTQTQGNSFTSIALLPSGNQIILVSQKKMFVKNLNSGDSRCIYEALGKIKSINVSEVGRYVCAATEQQKCVVIDLDKERRMKCRPGHGGAILYAFFSKDEKFIASIGEDKMLVIYEIFQDKEPQEVSRSKIIRKEGGFKWVADFYKNSRLMAVPGCQQVQYLELNGANKWSPKKTAMKHQKTIVMCKFINEILLGTSCSDTFLIWDMPKEQKLVVIENFPISKLIPLYGTFFAVNNNGSSEAGGKIYQYTKKLQQVPQPMDLQNDNLQGDVIRFEGDEKGKEPQNEDEQSEDEEQDEEEYQHYVSKKSKADKIITVYPQAPLSTGTSFFDGSRFLLTTLYGNIIERRGDGQDHIIEVQLQQRKQSKMILFRNRDIRYFAMNQNGIAFANESQFGFWGRQFKMWQKKWVDILGIAVGNSWIAVMNAQEVMVLDFVGNQLRAFGFDRQFVAMDGFENMLAIVYHETVPIWGNQCLSMQLFTIDCQRESKDTKFNLPIRPQSVLRWFGFSQEGMLISQDSLGGIRAFNLSTKIWTSIQVNQLLISKRVWIVGMTKYQIKYWKTTQLEPEPTVSPRLNQKLNILFISTLENEQNQEQSKLLWKRFCLDHQKARNQHWGKYRARRSQDHPHYNISRTIMSELQNQQANIALDNEYMELARTLLREENSQKALHLAKNLVRSVKVGKELADLFDQFKLRKAAIQLQKHYDQIERELEYENMQAFKFEQLKKEIEKTIKPKSDDPMKRKGERFSHLRTGFTQSSANSLNSSRVQSYENDVPKRNAQLILSTSKSTEPLQIDNPFLKRKDFLNEDAEKKKQEIEDQLIRKKTQDKSLIMKGKRQKNI